MGTPAYWQVRKIRALWPDTPIYKIAPLVNAGKQTIINWRDAGYLDPLPERNVKRGNYERQPPSVRKVNAAPLTPEPLCECQPCEKCRFELMCRERVRVGLWVACERVAA